MLAHADGGVEVTKRLKMVLNVAPAFVEQIVVDRAFFIDWHQPVQDALAELETLGGNLHHRAAVHFEDVVHRVALGMVGAAGHRDLGEQTVLLLIAAANSLQSARDAARGDADRRNAAWRSP